MIPCDSTDSKRNRNLHAIKLINQMINNRLEEPYNRQANSINDLMWLSPIQIKSELSKKFIEEIDFQKVENFGYQQQKIFIEKHPEIINERYMENEYIKKEETEEYKGKTEKEDNIEKLKDGINLNKLYFNYNKEDLHKMDKYKLISLVLNLQEKMKEKDEIINYQLKQIELLNNNNSTKHNENN